MGYVIETRQPCAYCTHCGYSGRVGSPECLHARETWTEIDTMEEARADILTTLADIGAIGGPEDDLCGDVLDLTESGGSIELPDGTTIAVRHED